VGVGNSRFVEGGGHAPLTSSQHQYSKGGKGAHQNVKVYPTTRNFSQQNGTFQEYRKVGVPLGSGQDVSKQDG